MAHFLITGASGFVGSNLIPFLQERGHTVRAAVRRSGSAPDADEEFLVDDLNDETDWSGAFTDVDAVIHLAARVHVMNETAEDPLAEFQKINVAGTKALAVAAVDAGVKRFVFLSSIKVNGEGGEDVVYAVDDQPAPEDPYGVSKLEAEEALRELEKTCGLEPVIIRTPLVYGPRVGGNFARLMKLASLPIPLPFGSVNNKRAMISIRNLSDCIEKSATAEEAAGSLLLVSDGSSLSTTELIRSLRIAQGKNPWLMPIPVGAMKNLLKIVGKQNLSDRLLGSLDVDNGSTNPGFQWRPIETPEAGIEKTMKSEASTNPDSQKHLVFVVTVDWFFISHRLPLAEEAVKRGYKVTVVAADSGRANEIREVGANFIDFPFSRSGKNPISEFATSVKLLFTLRKIKPTIAHFVALKPVVFGSLAAVFMPWNARKVYAITGFGHLFSAESGPGILGQSILSFLKLAWKVPNSNVIVQNSDHYDFLIEQCIAHPSSVSLIQGAGVSIEEYKNLGKATEPPTAVMAARLLYSKGVLEFIEAASGFNTRYPNKIKFLLIGPVGDDNPEAIGTEDLKSLLARSPVEWLGHRNDIAEILGTSSLAILPSYAEGMPRFLIEAMATENLIITTKIPGCKQLVEGSGVGWLVSPKDSHDLMNAIERAYHRRKEWGELGVKSRDFVRQDLSLEKVLEQTFEVYETEEG